jgi:hypothetical protein
MMIYGITNDAPKTAAVEPDFLEFSAGRILWNNAAGVE